MSEDERIARRLRDLSQFAREAAYLTAKGEAAYREDSLDGALLRSAGERILIKVATVVEKLPDTFKERYPAIDWVGIRGMRNLVAHHDDGVNDDLMWRTLRDLIPRLVRDLGIDPD